MSVTVSIIIPLFNKVEVIGETLNSLVQQSFADWECIVVNDGSTDGSDLEVLKFISNYPGKFQLIHQVNQGQAKARLEGISRASGEFLAFLDADDLWTHSKLQGQVQAMHENPDASIVLSSYAIFGKNVHGLRVVRQVSAPKMLRRWLDMSGFGGGLESVGLVRRSCVTNSTNFDPHLSTSSGLDFALKFSHPGEIVVLRAVGLFYRLSSGQWHTDQAELRRNMALISDRYSTLYSGNLQRSHDAYFFWSDAKKKGGLNFALEVLKSAFSPFNGRLRMFVSLSSRNLKSLLLGLLLRKHLLDELNYLTSSENGSPLKD